MDKDKSNTWINLSAIFLIIWIDFITRLRIAFIWYSPLYVAVRRRGDFWDDIFHLWIKSPFGNRKVFVDIFLELIYVPLFWLLHLPGGYSSGSSRTCRFAEVSWTAKLMKHWHISRAVEHGLSPIVIPFRMRSSIRSSVSSCRWEAVTFGRFNATGTLLSSKRTTKVKVWLETKKKTTN